MKLIETITNREQMAKRFSMDEDDFETLPDGGKFVALHMYEYGEYGFDIKEYDNGKYSVTIENGGEYGTLDECLLYCRNWAE